MPSFAPSIAPWAQLALGLHDEIMEAGRERAVSSVGIPTWFYGHEPPNVFCDAIGKYFSNAIREDGLLARCTAGLVVLEGAAGTVQEIFQAATRLYYAPAGDADPADGAGGREALDRDRAGVGRPAGPGRRAATWLARSTSSTTSPRCRRSCAG